jgi:hypothetical protein
VALILLPVLLLGVGCRGEEPAAPAPGVDQQVSDVESTLDAIESEVAGD